MNQTANSLENIIQELATAPHHPANLPACSCHIINPRVHRLILWKEIDPVTKEEKYTLRIGSQRFTSYPNCDKNGQTYWLFNPSGFYADKPELNPSKNSSNNNSHVSESKSIPTTPSENQA